MLDTTTTFSGLAGTVRGSDDALPPFVFLHGLTFDRRMWEPVADALEEAQPGRRSLALDLPGHGDSPRRASYALEEVAAAVHDAIVEAGLEAPIVVGHSIGAIAAAIYAGRHPVSGVVGVDQLLVVDGFVAQLHELEPLLRGPQFPEVWREFDRSMRPDLVPPARRGLAESHARQDVVLGYWEQVFSSTAAELRALAERDLVPDVPYLLVAGAEPGAAYREWLESRVPSSRVVVFDGAGHFPHLVDPARFVAELLR
jgi:pimeloyl-ACP methyl ester carboxylesterase